MYSNPEGYDRYMGRWSARLAPLFLEFVGVCDGQRLLDVGSGTGVLSLAITATVEAAEIVGIDPAKAYVDYAKTRLTDRHARFEVGDARTIPFGDAAFDATMALLILQEIPDTAKAVAEMRRVTKPGGRVAACQWDFRDGLPMLSLFWDAVEEVKPGAATRREAVKRVPTGCADQQALVELWRDGGLVEVETTGLEIPMEFASFDDYWSPFLGGATPTSSYASSLPSATRQALVEALRDKLLGNRPDGPFTLPARGWAVRGTVPFS